MGIKKLKNTQPHNIFIDSIARNVAPGGQFSLPDSVVESDPDIAQCLAMGVLEVLEEHESDPSLTETKTMEVEPEPQPDPEPEPEPAAHEVELELDGDAVVATGDGKTERVKPMSTADIPLPEWLDQEQLRRSEAAAEAYDRQEGLVEEWRVTDEGVEKTRGGRTEVVSENGVTTRKASDPNDAVPEPVKVAKVKRTDDGENDPMITEEGDEEDYSSAFVDQQGETPDAGYGNAFIDQE